jgi:anti-sigma B factor antagonist
VTDAPAGPSQPGTAPEEAVTTSLDQLTVTVDAAATPPVIALAGELDPHTAPLLERAVAQLLAEGSTDLVLDLSRLAFVDSSGLRVLISAQRQLADQGGTLTLHTPSETVRRLLEITGLIDHIAITGL